MTLPCKECIVLPICNTQYKRKADQPYTSALDLSFKCSIMTNYVKEHPRKEGDTMFEPIMKFFATI